MELNLKGKVALVSGSSRGIGKGIAEILLAHGCRVFINGRDKTRLDKVAEEMGSKDYPGKVFQIDGDLTVTQRIKDSLDSIVRDHGSLDIVVANIGTGRSVAGWDIDDEEWLRMIDINLLSAVRLCRESIRVMKERKSGSIVCISSIAGCEAISAPLPYSAAKAALLNFVKNTSNIVADHGIRINAISPGNVLAEGGTWERKINEDRDKVMSYINSTVPLKDFATPSDIGNLALYLVSDLARFITGANFVIDGGQVRKFI